MNEKTPSQQIDDIIAKSEGWKAECLSHLRKVITQADPEVVEEVKWKMPTRPEGLPVWSYNGIICFAETWKEKIVLIFFNGAQMSDPHKLFNARLKSAKDRAVEFRENYQIDETAIQGLVLEGIGINKAKKQK